MGELVHAVAETEIGAVLVAVGSDGLREVRLGRSVASLLSAFEAEFPESIADATLEGTAVGMALLPKDGTGAPPLPLVLAGTPFQRLVWDRLRSVPRGTTLSYAALAADVRAPKAVRAVASACGANRIALAIPCHRIIRTDGGLGGYRWGLGLKRRLLDLESLNRERGEMSSIRQSFRSPR